MNPPGKDDGMNSNIRPMEPMDVHRGMKQLTEGRPINVTSPNGTRITIQKVGPNRYAVMSSDTGRRTIADYSKVYQSLKWLLNAKGGVKTSLRLTED